MIKKLVRLMFMANQVGDEYVIHVRDDGPGILPELHHKAIKMFQTLKPRDETEGSGMGLAIVRKITEHYGGSISIDSDGSFGTTIVVRWPR